MALPLALPDLTVLLLRAGLKTAEPRDPKWNLVATTILLVLGVSSGRAALAEVACVPCAYALYWPHLRNSKIEQSALLENRSANGLSPYLVRPLYPLGATAPHRFYAEGLEAGAEIQNRIAETSLHLPDKESR